MALASIKILPDNINIQTEPGSNLLDTLKKSGLAMNAACGGKGTCGKCMVKYSGGEFPLLSSNSRLPNNMIEAGYFESCSATVTGDMEIEIPAASRLDNQKTLMAVASSDPAYSAAVIEKSVAFRIFMKLNSPDADNPTNDLDRFKTSLKLELLNQAALNCNELIIPIELIRALPFILREQNFEITAYVIVYEDHYYVTGIKPGACNDPLVGLAVDIGTTTIAAALVDLVTGEVLASNGTYNSQASYGSDVISRIIYADTGPGLEVLRSSVLKSINLLTDDLLAASGIDPSLVCAVICAGNTVMTSIFYGVPVMHLRLEPYVPAAVEFPPLLSGGAGLSSVNPYSVLISVPSVASYVGGDITSGVLASGIDQDDRLSLFIDIGTNGELVLGHRDWLVSCSCSAGPAFEGSGIKCGMRAMNGAIDSFSIDSCGSLKYSVIGNTAPAGVCGSGLISLLDIMVSAGFADRAGNLTANVRDGDDGLEMLLVPASDSAIHQDIVITQGDIRNILRSKAAIFAGIRTMLKSIELDVESIERVLIAGGFGNSLDIEKAIGIGLLPYLPSEKYSYIGNASLKGVITLFRNREDILRARQIASGMTYLELSNGTVFMDEFVSALFLPHTHMELFGDSIMKGVD